MKAVQILMDEDLIRSVDAEARRLRSDRSKVVRAALNRFLKERRVQRLERQYIEGCRKHPPTAGEIEAWERIQEWPPEG